MKIVNLTEFRALPNGTVYSRYEPCVFEGLEIKEDTWVSDFVCMHLVGNIEWSNEEPFIEKCKKMEKGESVSLDFDSCGRDGGFEKDQLFAIYEEKDIKGLIKKLESSCKDSNKVL